MAIKHIIDQKRHCSEDLAGKLAEALDLDDREREYFAHLVYYSKTNREDEKSARLKKLLQLKHPDMDAVVLNAHEDAGYFSSWLGPALAELSYCRDFQQDPFWIQNTLKEAVGLKEIKRLLSVVRSRGLLKGMCREAVKRVLPSGVGSTIYKAYTKSLIQHSMDALDSQPLEDREHWNLVISVDSKRMADAKRLLREMQQQIHACLASTDPCDRVIQINVNLATLINLDQTSR